MDGSRPNNLAVGTVSGTQTNFEVDDAPSLLLGAEQEEKRSNMHIAFWGTLNILHDCCVPYVAIRWRDGMHEYLSHMLL